MFGGISYIGWFHTILGIAAIVIGLYLLIKDRFIFMNTNLAKFYLLSTVITCASSFLLYGATGSFNTAHWLSVITILAVLFALVLNRYNIFGFLTVYLKQLALTGTVFFSMLPTTAEVLQRLPPSNPIVDSIEDPLVQSFYMSYVVIFGLFGIYQVVKIYRENIDGV
ncbi:hypothetical protein OAD25_01800 [Gammaproteobacteria bacterium]|jgi:uncharacterized membrane protein|nr:hypothetical protein [Gammaproteobacteria bacterium]MDA9578196.1 hypothetical protein [Gammaproteobacteria bacterium]MDB9898393.1 hypothetical protein [Gammaproteobacteria bacterium]